MKDFKQIKVFISCPGDIIDELNSIRIITEEINKTAGKQNSYNLELLNWKTDTYTQVGSDAQEVINKQLESEYDILVGLLWQKIGTPTKRDKSGTIEEINLAISNKDKEQLIYFKTTPPDNLNLIDIDQLSKINSFKRELSDKGLLYKEFNSISNFESLFRINLTNLIIDKVLSQKQEIEKKLSVIQPNDKYSSINDLITEVENKDESILDLDIFELAEETESYINMISSSLNSMTNTITDLATILTKRTEELNRFKKIKDERLKISKAKTIINLLANELDEFNNRINNELPIFSENFTEFGHAYSKLMIVAANYDNNDTSELNQSAIEFRDSVEFATEGCASLLREIVKWPPVNSKFNKSKRETELCLKTLTKELLEGLILLNETITN